MKLFSHVILLSILIALANFSCSQRDHSESSVQIAGALAHFDPQAEVGLFRVDPKDPNKLLSIQMANVKENAFSMEAQIAENDVYRLTVKTAQGSRSCEIYLEPGKSYRITTETYPNQDGYRFNVESNSDADKQWQALLDIIAQNDLAYYNAVQQIKSNMGADTMTRDSIIVLNRARILKNEKVRHDFINANQRSPITLVLIARSENKDVKGETYLTVLEKQPKKQQSTDLWIKTKRNLEFATRLAVGKKAPLPLGYLPNDSGYVFKDTGHKLLLIDLGTIESKKSMEFKQKLKPIYDQYKSKGFEVVSVYLDSDREAWKRKLERYHLPWDQVCEGKVLAKSKNAEAFVVREIPSNLLVDGKGLIVAHNVWPYELEDYILSHTSM